MKLTEILPASLVFADLGAVEKEEALKEMADGIVSHFPNLKDSRLLSVILDREKLGSTGIGSGIAIPHAKLPNLYEHIAAFGRSRPGIPFDSIDGKPVHLIFLIIGPMGANEAHLKALARISKFLHDTTFRDRLLTAETPELIYESILQKDAQY